MQTLEDRNYDLLCDVFSEFIKGFEEVTGDPVTEDVADKLWDVLRNPVLNRIELN